MKVGWWFSQPGFGWALTIFIAIEVSEPRTLAIHAIVVINSNQVYYAIGKGLESEDVTFKMVCEELVEAEEYLAGSLFPVPWKEADAKMPK